MITRLTDIQLAKGFALDLTKDDFKTENGFDEQAFVEAQANFSYLNIEEYLKVKSRYGYIVPFKLHKVQKLMMRAKLEQLREYGYCRIMSLKSRQLGSSAFWITDMVVNAKLRNFGCSIVAHKKEATGKKSLFKYVSNTHKYWLEAEERGELKKGFTDHERFTLDYLEFKEGGGKIQLVTANLDAVGDTNQYVLISEAPRIQGYADFWESMVPSLPKGNHSTCIVESTARYTGPEFYNDWKEQWEYEKESGKIPMPRSIFLPCYMVEEYCYHPLPDGYSWDKFWDLRAQLKKKNIDPDDLYGHEDLLVKRKWYDYYDRKWIELPLNFWYWRRLTIDEQKSESGSGFKKIHWFNQNYPMTPEEAELVAGDSVFPRQEIQKRRLLIEAPTFRGDIKWDEKEKKPKRDGETRRIYYQEWDVPQPGLSYYLFLDPANEKQGDYWAALVFSPMQNMFTAMLRMNNATTQEVLERLVPIGWRWNTALLGWEANLAKISDTILTKLLKRDYVNPPGTPYPNLYKRLRKDDVKKKNYKKNPEYGFWLANNKGSIIQIWMDVVYNEKFDIHQEEILDELWFMRQNVNKDGYLQRNPNAPKGKNDDLIIAGGGAMFMARELPDRWDLLKQQALLKQGDPDDPYDRYVANFKKYLNKDVKRRDALMKSQRNGRQKTKKFTY